MEDLRIPLEIAVEEPRLLRDRWYGNDSKGIPGLSLPQKVVVKAMYGLPLSDDVRDDRGWSELDYFFAFHGHGRFDDLGFLISVDTPVRRYVPHEYSETWLNEGVRSGKSTVASFVLTYEGTCGGHEGRVRAGRRLYCFQIAQDLRQARYALHDIEANLESMPFVTQRLAGGGSRIIARTADRIDLWNGVTISTVPPTVKSVRGYDSPVAVLDEVAVWYQEADSANPDFEIYRQVKSRQAQFTYPKIIGLSSPWNKGGLLWQRCQAGTDGIRIGCDDHKVAPKPMVCEGCAKAQRPHKGRLVLTMPTAAVNNPLVTKQWLEEYRAADPRAFRRECLAEFLDSVSGFLDPDRIREAVSNGVKERPPAVGNFYVAAMDPAFRNDIFSFGIAHTDVEGKVVIDVLQRWVRDPAGPPLDPAEKLAAVAGWCKKYGVVTVGTDQYQNESLSALSVGLGIALQEFNFQAGSKAEVYGSLAAIVNQRRLVLLDHEETINELLSIEKTLTHGGNVHIAAPRGLHDDMATVVALLAKQAVWTSPAAEPIEPPEPTIQEQIKEQIQQRWVVETDEW